VTQSKAERRYVRMAAAANSKAARLGTPGRVTASDFAMAYLRHEGQCPYCGIGLDPLHCSFDHVIPYDRGGPNVIENIVPCCITCQRSKGTKLQSEYAIARTLTVECETCGKVYKPRWADWGRGYGRICSRACAGSKGGKSPRKVPA